MRIKILFAFCLALAASVDGAEGNHGRLTFTCGPEAGLSELREFLEAELNERTVALTVKCNGDEALLGVAGAKIIADALISQGAEHLKELSLLGGNITDDGAEALAPALKGLNTALERLDLSGNSIRSGFVAIAKALQNPNSKLAALDLSSNKLDDYVVEDFVCFLESRGYPSLEVLDVSHNNINWQAATRLCQAITVRGWVAAWFFGSKGHAALKSLNLSDNRIEERGMQALARALPSSSLQSLSVTLPTFFRSEKSAQAFFEAVLVRRPASLERLSLLTHPSWGAPNAVRGLISALPYSRFLKSLRIEGLKLEEAGAKALAEALENDSSLESLEVRACGIDANGAEAVVAALQHRVQALELLDIRENNVGVAGLIALISSEKLEKIRFTCPDDESDKKELAKELEETLRKRATMVQVILDPPRLFKKVFDWSKGDQAIIFTWLKHPEQISPTSDMWVKQAEKTIAYRLYKKKIMLLAPNALKGQGRQNLSPLELMPKELIKKVVFFLREDHPDFCLPELLKDL